MLEYALEHIDIEVNHRCNLACRHCSARAAKGRKPAEMDEEQIKTILSEAVPLGLRKIGLTGGEPLYDVPKLRAMAEYCLGELGIPVHMHTNGTLVEDEHCCEGGVLALFESMSITFLGGDSATHNSMTRIKGSFERTFRGAEISAKHELPLTCYFIPTQGTCDSFKRLAEQLCGVGVKRIRAMALAPSGRARGIYGETAPTSDELREFEKDLLGLRDKLDLHIEAGNCTRLSMPSLAVLAGHDECMSAVNRVHINSRSDVFPCTAASGVKELRVGNVIKNGRTIIDLWRDSSTLGRMRKMHAGELEACEQCTYKPKCRFACTVNACGTMSDEERRRCPIFSHNG